MSVEKSPIRGTLSTTSGESWKGCWTIFLSLSLSPRPPSERNRAIQRSDGYNEMGAREARLSVRKHLFPDSLANSGSMAGQNRVCRFPDNISNHTHPIGTEQNTVLEETDEEVLADEGRSCHKENWLDIN